MVKTTARVAWIDGLKFFAILLVVWGHVLPRLGMYSGEYAFTGLHGFIYSFHMPLFMTLSGYVSYKIVDGEIDIFRKFRQLIVPCITLFVICLAVGLDENYWYLKSLFLCYCLFGLYIKVGLKYKLIFCLFGCIAIFPLLYKVPYLSCCKIDFMLPFFGIGLLIRKYSSNIENNLFFYLLLSFILFLLCELLWNKEYIWYYSRPSWINYRSLVCGHELIINLENIFQVVFRYFTGAIGTLFFVTLFMALYKYEYKWALLAVLKNWGGGILYTSIFYIHLL